MDRVILHWTAGTNTASGLDRQHYHRMVEGDGKVRRGTEAIEDNITTADDDYAAHTLRLNTGSIGVAVCGMHDAQESPFDAGPYPINQHQLEAAAELIADLCVKYDIPVSRRTVLTHAEVEPTLGVKQRGKWDIARLPWLPNLRGAIPVGDHIRSLVEHHMGAPDRSPVPILARGDTGSHVQRAQLGLGVEQDGVFGPDTERAVMRFQEKHGLAVDGIVGPETWADLSKERQPDPAPTAEPEEPVTPTGNAKGGIIAVVLAILAAIAAKIADLF